MSYYIKVSKIDYLTWKIMALVLLAVCLILLFLYQQKPNEGEIKDNWWHIGYNDCSVYYNFTSDEQMKLNEWKAIKTNCSFASYYQGYCR